MCRKHNFIFICNENIRKENLWKDSLPLNDSGMEILADNFINMLNSIFLCKGTITSLPGNDVNQFILPIYEIFNQ